MFRLGNGDPAPAVLMCNPNAGMYEHSDGSGDWLDFYGKHGFTVVQFNYGCVCLQPVY